MGFGIDRRARSRKGRGLFRKAPDPREVGDRFGRLMRRMFKLALTRAGWGKERYVAELVLFAGAPSVTFVVGSDAELSLSGDAAPLGPAFIAELVDKLAPILDELDFVWTEPFDLARTQAAMCEWLAGELRGSEQVQFGVTRRFRIDAPLIGPLGPRDAAWRDAVVADPSRAADAFPWWERGPGTLERARALIAMWNEVAWREPLDADERELMKSVDEDLRAARKADKNLALPWADWKELLALLGIEDEDVSEKAGTSPATIGYRRHDLEIELSGGWHVRLPGAMVGRWEDDGGRYWATDGDRAIEFTSFTVDGEGDSAKLLAVAPEAHPVVDRFVADGVHGRAEAFTDEDVPVVVGLVASAPHVGILTVKGGDQAWALSTWRSLRLS
ncbi:MAG: hypothetical protein HOV81_25265 [Kofleriaceae bacterium]|nr:hypothetical protein [Kofleriaceae bacterium]